MANKKEVKKKVPWEKTRSKWQQRCPEGTHRVRGKGACVKMTPRQVESKRMGDEQTDRIGISRRKSKKTGYKKAWKDKK